VPLQVCRAGSFLQAGAIVMVVNANWRQLDAGNPAVFELPTLPMQDAHPPAWRTGG